MNHTIPLVRPPQLLLTELFDKIALFASFAIIMFAAGAIAPLAGSVLAAAAVIAVISGRDRMTHVDVAVACSGILAGAVLSSMPAVAAGTEGPVVTLDPILLSFLVGSVMPLLTSLVTKLDASSPVKGTVNLLLSVAGGVLAAFVTNNGALRWDEIAGAAITVYLSGQSLYTGIYRHTVAPAVAKIAPTTGIG